MWLVNSFRNFRKSVNYRLTPRPAWLDPAAFRQVCSWRATGSLQYHSFRVSKHVGFKRSGQKSHDTRETYPFVVIDVYCTIIFLEELLQYPFRLNICNHFVTVYPLISFDIVYVILQFFWIDFNVNFTAQNLQYHLLAACRVLTVWIWLRAMSKLYNFAIFSLYAIHRRTDHNITYQLLLWNCQTYVRMESSLSFISIDRMKLCYQSLWNSLLMN